MEELGESSQMNTDGQECVPIEIGEKFFSYAQLQRRINEHKRATMTDFWVKDCSMLRRMMATCPRAAKAHPDLKYYYVTYGCIFGGKYRPKGDPINRTRKFVGSFRQGCPYEMTIGLSKDASHLHVRKMVKHHNHDLNPSLLRQRPCSKERLATVRAADSNLQKVHRKIVHEGFVYNQIQPMRKGRMYLKCVSAACPGRAKKLLGENGKCHIVPTKPHTHNSDPVALERLQFIEKVTQRSQKEALSLRRIFETELLNYPMLSMDFEQHCGIMASARECCIPFMPKTMQEYSFILVSEEWCSRFGCNLEEPPRELFMGMVKGNGGETAAVFASVYLSQVMNKPISEIFIDVGYKKVPKNPSLLKFLLSIHFLENNCSFAAVYAAMTSRSLSAYMAVLKFIRDELLPDCIPENIYTGYEAEIQMACKNVFPEAKVQGSTYYFSKGIEDKYTDLKMAESPKLKQLVKAFTALPLLPASLMEPGLNAVASTMTRSNLGIKCMELIQHVRYSLLEGIGVADISAHEQPQRSNLNIKHWYQELDSLVDEKLLTSWRFIEILQSLEESHRVDHVQMCQGEEVQAIRQTAVAVLDLRVTQAIKELNAGNIGIMDFLITAAQVVS